MKLIDLDEWSEDFIRRQLATLADAPFAETDADVQFGRPFKARCANLLEPTGARCEGVLLFTGMAVGAPCDTCGAQCGRLVAHWGP